MRNIFEKSVFFAIMFVMTNLMKAQSIEMDEPKENKSYFASIYLGTQISGNRKEDRVSSNFTPYAQIGFGKKILAYLSLAINYQGPYFHFISDEYKHRCLFINGEAILNVKNLMDRNALAI